MKTYPKAKYLLLLLLLLPVTNIFASHLAGGEISYKCIGLRKWEIRLVAYRDCVTGIPMPQCASGSQTGCTKTLTVKPMATIAGGGLNPNGCTAPIPSLSVTLTSYKIESVTKLIEGWQPNKKNICTNNGTTSPGTATPAIEKYYYLGILDMSSPAFAAANVCPYWEVAWEECCRNSGIANISNPGGTNFYVRSVINIHYNTGTGNCANNSPVINIQPYMTYCSGVPIDINYGAFDPDNDSLSYKLIKAKGGGGVDASYSSPLSEYRPFPLHADRLPHSLYPNPNGANVVLDSSNGNLSFNAANLHPTNLIFGQLAVQITQWAKHTNGTRYVAGLTVGDYQFYIRNCGSNKPINFTTGGGNLPSNIYVNINQPISFSVVAKDDNTADTTRFLQWVVSDPNIIVTRPDSTKLHDSLVITYTPSIQSSNTRQSVTFLAADNVAVTSFQSRQILFEVINNTGFKSTINNFTDSCKNYTFSHTNDSNIAMVNWQISKTPNDFSLGNAYAFGNSITTPKVSFTQPGKYLVRLNVTKTLPTNGFGFITDTITVTANSITITNSINFDTTICPGGSRTMILPNGNYNWYVNNQTTVFASNDTLTVSPATSTNYRYSGTLIGGNYNGCVLTDTANIIVSQLSITNTINFDTTICPGGSRTMILPNGNYNWYVNNQTTVFASNDTLTVTPTTSTNYRYSGTIVGGNYNGCMITDTANIIVNQLPYTTLPDTMHSCNNSMVHLKAKNQNAISTTYLWSNAATADSIAVTQPGLYTVTLTQSNGCVASDSVRVINNLPPQITARADTAVCWGTPTSVYAQGNATNVRWYNLNNNSQISTASAFSFTPTVSSTPIRLLAYNNLIGCATNDTFVLTMHNKIILTRPTDLKVCDVNTNEVAFNKFGTSVNGSGVWSFAANPNALRVSNDTAYINAGLLPKPTKAGYNFYYAGYAFTDSLGCKAKDSAMMLLHSTPVVDANIDRTFCNNAGSFTLATSQGATPVGGQFYRVLDNATVSTIQLNGYTGLRAYYYRVLYTYPGFSCASGDTFNITSKPAPELTRPVVRYVCNDSAIITLPQFVSNMPSNIGQWSYTAMPSALTVNGNNQAFLNISLLPQPSVTTSKSHWIKYSETFDGCTTNDSANIYVFGLPPVNAGSDKGFCSGASAFNLRSTLTPNPSNGQFYKVGTNDTISFLNPATALPNTSLYYRAPLSHGIITCYNNDTVNIQVGTQAVLTRPNAIDACSHLEQIKLNDFVSTPAINGTWSYPAAPTALSTNNNETFLNMTLMPQPNDNSFRQYWIKYQADNAGCVTKDSALVTAYYAVSVDAGTDKEICSNEASFNINTKQNPSKTGGVYIDALGDTVTTFNPSSAQLLPYKHVFNLLHSFVYSNITCISGDEFSYTITPQHVLQNITGNLNPTRNSTQTYVADYNPYRNYTWQVGGGVKQSSDSNRVTVLWTDTVGTFVKVDISNTACGNASLTKNITVIGSSGLSEQHNWLQQFEVYPNPAQHKVSVSFNSNHKQFTIQLFNSTMQEITNTQLTAQGGKISTELDVQHLSSGLYFIKVSNGANHKLVKLVVSE